MGALGRDPMHGQSGVGSIGYRIGKVRAGV